MRPPRRRRSVLCGCFSGVFVPLATLLIVVVLPINVYYLNHALHPGAGRAAAATAAAASSVETIMTSRSAPQLPLAPLPATALRFVADPPPPPPPALRRTLPLPPQSAAAAVATSGAPAKRGEEVMGVWRAATSRTSPYAAGRPDFFMLSAHLLYLPRGYDPRIHDATHPPPAAASGVEELESTTLVLGEGQIDAVSFPSPSTVTSDLVCEWGDVLSDKRVRTIPTTPAQVQLMRYKLGAIDYREQRTPYSSRDAYQTHYLLCRPPPGFNTATAGATVATAPTLRAITSPSTGWKLEIKVSDVVAGPSPAEAAAQAAAKMTTNEQQRAPALTVCAAPIYGYANIRWLIEWLEYLRAVGATTVHVPMHEDVQDAKAAAMWAVLRHYASGSFAGGFELIIHHWSKRASGGGTSDGAIYEKAKYLAWDECYLRSRGRTDWMVFIDIDELPYASEEAAGTLTAALRACEALLGQSGGQKVGCAMDSVTATSVFKGVESYATSQKLLLDEYDYVESAPMCPYNCGQYHRGRQKYVLSGARNLKQVPLMLWTHAVGGQDYPYANAVMAQLPASTMHVRHYSGWWYTNAAHTEMNADEHLKRKSAPIARAALQRIAAALKGSPELMAMYRASPAQKGVTWVKATAKVIR